MMDWLMVYSIGEHIFQNYVFKEAIIKKSLFF
jgi:hypothetical protein